MLPCVIWRNYSMRRPFTCFCRSDARKLGSGCLEAEATTPSLRSLRFDLYLDFHLSSSAEIWTHIHIRRIVCFLSVISRWRCPLLQRECSWKNEKHTIFQEHGALGCVGRLNGAALCVPCPPGVHLAPSAARPDRNFAAALRNTCVGTATGPECTAHCPVTWLTAGKAGGAS